MPLLSHVDFRTFVKEDVKTKLIEFFDDGHAVELDVSDDLAFEYGEEKYFIRKILRGEYIEGSQKMFIIAQVSKIGNDHELRRVEVKLRLRPDYTEAFVHFTH